MSERQHSLNRSKLALLKIKTKQKKNGGSAKNKQKYRAARETAISIEALSTGTVVNSTTVSTLPHKCSRKLVAQTNHIALVHLKAIIQNE